MKFSKPVRQTAISAAIGIIITGFLIYAQRQALRIYDTNLPLTGLAHHVKSEILAAHAVMSSSSFEDNVDFNAAVTDRLQEVSLSLEAAYNGTEGPDGEFSKLQDEERRALIKFAAVNVGNLQAAAPLAWAESRGGSKGSAFTKYNELHATALESIEKLEAGLRTAATNDLSAVPVLLWTSVAVTFFGSFFVTLLFFRLANKAHRERKDGDEQLQAEKKRVDKLSQFIESVSGGNYDIELEASGEDDTMTAMLVNMRDKLRQNADDDRRRNWATTGQAQIGEILRATTTTSSELYDNIIRFLVKYTGSNQGGLFILNEENEGDRFLELMACYAFERKKFLEKKVLIGDGLVGQTFLEGETVCLSEVPQEYINITSGLGGANPNALLIVPMKVNDNIYGVIELASFRKYESFEVELVEKLAESIASTISNVRVNETTRILLEKTQQQAEEMRSQEEEIRQNMEELEATQEEMRRKQTILERELEQSQKQADALRLQEKRLTESQDTLQAIVDNIPRAIFWKDRDLRFQGCNKIFSDIAGAPSPADLIGKTDFDMAWSAQAEAYRRDDMEVMKSRKPKLNIEEVNINSEGEESWVRTSKVPIVARNGEVVAILGMFEDITELKKREADVARKLEERERALQEIQALKNMLELVKR